MPKITYLIFFLWSTLLYGQGNMMYLQAIGEKNKLPDNTTWNVYQDKRGFLWIGTTQGLYLYNGSDIKKYEQTAHNSNSVINNEIKCILQDHNNLIWIGTAGGLSCFNPVTETFRSYLTQDQLDNNETNNVTNIYLDTRKQLWVSMLGRTEHSDILRLNPDSATFTKFRLPFMLHRSNPPAEDIVGNFWMVNEQGTAIYRFDTQNGQTAQYSIVGKVTSNHASMYSAPTPDGKLWFTNTDGIFLFSPADTSFTLVQALPNHERIFFTWDNQNRLWANNNHELLLFDNTQHKFNLFSKKIQPRNDNRSSFLQASNENILWFPIGNLQQFHIEGLYINTFTTGTTSPSRFVRSISQADTQSVWIGTFEGLFLYNLVNTTSLHIQANKKADIKATNKLSSINVWKITQDNDNTVWIATTNGINKLTKEKGAWSVKKFFALHAPDIEQPNNYFYVQDNFQKFNNLHQDADSSHIIWFCNYFDGLIRFDKRTETTQRFSYQQKNQNTLSNNSIWAITETGNGSLWIGTQQGLNLFDKRTGNVQRFYIDTSAIVANDKLQYSSRSANYILSLLLQVDTLWIGTMGGGLFRMNTNTKKIDRFGEKNGLSDNVIYSLLADNESDIWMSTDKGLYCYNRKQNWFLNFDKNSGLETEEFNRNAYFASPDGLLYFGSSSGVSVIPPLKVKYELQIPPVFITQFSLFNNPVTIGDSSILKQAISYSKAITLHHEQNFFSIEFAALAYRNAHKNTYKYKLEGFDKDWITTNAQKRVATYVNMPFGEYTFKVIAANSDGYWNTEGATLHIIILPPWYRTWWAYLLFFVIITFVIILSVSFWLQHQRLQHNRHQLFMQQQVIEKEQKLNQQLKQLDKMKDEFLANTSHELRTPLNSIIGITESLINSTQGELSRTASKDLRMVVASSKRLANLINDILDFSKLKNKTIQLKYSNVDLRKIVDEIVFLSRSLLHEKNLSITNQIPPDTILPADENRLQQIVFNLIDNAIKFTAEGSVRIYIEKNHTNNQHICIAVADTGIGIDPQKHEIIFRSFEQAEGSIARQYGGTGIGLAITKNLVELHDGKIWLESQLNKGAVFYFTLPLTHQQQWLQNDDTKNITLNTQKRNNNDTLQIPLDKEETTDEYQDVALSISKLNKRFNILIVDDDMFNLHVLKLYLSLPCFTITEASDGTEALSLIGDENNHFDLILLDVMMPNLSGYQVCNRIRSKYNAVQLPIIMLTAKDRSQDMVEGFINGANDYLVKPVDKNELLVRIDLHLSLLEANRQVLLHSATLEDKVKARTNEITQQKETLQAALLHLQSTQKQLVESEKMASLGSLVAGVAHEINTPVGVAITSISTVINEIKELIEKYEKGEMTQKEFEDYIQLFYDGNTLALKNLERTAHLVRSFKQISLDQHSEQQRLFNLYDYLHDIVTSLKPEFKHTQITINIHCPSDLIINSYPGAYAQILTNLLTNSKRHGFRNTNVGEINLDVKQENNKLCLVYTDNGNGISEKVLPRIFDPFFTTDMKDGTGLGLNIVYTLVTQRLGGSITCESREGEGVKFIMQLAIE